MIYARYPIGATYNEVREDTLKDNNDQRLRLNYFNFYLFIFF